MKKSIDLERKDRIVGTAVAGIIVHALFSFFKIFVGVRAESSAVLSDGIESFAEAGALIIILTGILYATKKPDHKHPMGYGRIELVGDIIIGSTIVYASLVAITAAIKQIKNPAPYEYDGIMLAVVALSIPVKLIIAKHEKSTGKEISSRSLITAGTHTEHSIFISVSVLVSAVLELNYSINIEVYVAIAVAGLSLYHAFSMLKTSTSEMIGKRMDLEFIDSLKKTVMETEQVKGVYDISLHNYGNGKIIGSLHIEIPASLKALEIDHIEREIFRNVYERHSLILEGIGIYAIDYSDETACEIRKDMSSLIEENQYVLGMHGLVIDHNAKDIGIDIVVSFDAPESFSVSEIVSGRIKKLFPDYTVTVREDIDLY